jgi:hypothetical protein
VKIAVTAALAAFAALAGTALASGPDATTGAVDRKAIKKIARKQANKAIERRGSPFAYARIEGDGSVAAAPPPKNITAENVTAPSTGVRCFQLRFAPGTAAGNSEADVQDDTIISLDLVPPFIGCPADAEAEVRTVDAQTGLENEGVYIQFSR